jgi:hypothetical protein
MHQPSDALACAFCCCCCRSNETFPRLADPIGYVDKDDIFHAIKAIVATQRDYGRRDDRKQVCKAMRTIEQALFFPRLAAASCPQNLCTLLHLHRLLFVLRTIWFSVLRAHVTDMLHIPSLVLLCRLA